MKYDIIIRAGVAGCGNTLIQLVLRYILGESRVLGTHRYIDNLETPTDLNQHKIGIVMPCRDFRSAVASNMRKRKILPTQAGIGNTYNDLFMPMYNEFHKFRTTYPHTQNVLLLSYPLFFDDYDYLLDTLQSFLEITISDQQRNVIKKQFSMQANKKRIAELNLQEWSDVDKTTLLHGSHIGTGKPDSWKTFFPSELHEFITKLMWSELVEYEWEKN